MLFLKAVFKVYCLLIILALASSRASNNEFNGEDEILPDSILEEKQLAYERNGVRDLQTTTSDLCSSVMEVTLVNEAGVTRTQVLYPVKTGYPNNLRRCLILKPSVDISLTAELTFISTEPSFDFVEAYTIESYNQAEKTISGVGDRLLQLSGMTLPEDKESRRVRGSLGQMIMLVLRTDANKNDWTGFKAKVTAKYRDCYHGMTVVQTKIDPVWFSDGYKAQYPPNYALCWVVIPPAKEYVKVEFTAMSTEEDMDTVEVAIIESFDAKKKEYYDKKSVIGIYSGHIVPEPIYAPADKTILISFRSDDALQLPGFSGKLSSPGPYVTNAPTKRPTRADCESGLTVYDAPEDSMITITDGFKDYPRDQVFCYMIVPANNETTATVDFSQLSLKPDGTDRIEVFALRKPFSRDITDRFPNTLVSIDGYTQIPLTVAGGPAQTIVIQFWTSKYEDSGGFKSLARSSTIHTFRPTSSPTAPECRDGFKNFPAIPLGQEIEFDLALDEGAKYPPNYQYCVVIRGKQGQLLSITFEDLDIANDQIFVFQARNVKAPRKTIRGRAKTLAMIDSSTPSESLTVISEDSKPTVVSFRADDQDSGRGFRARVRSIPPLPTASPTPLRRCGTKMTAMMPTLKLKKFNDGFKNVRRGSEVCWVIRVFNANPNAISAVLFDSLNLGTGAKLTIGTITSYNVKQRLFDGYEEIQEITEPNTRVESPPGSLLMISLSTDTEGKATKGFTARFFAPCVCPLFASKKACSKASCDCEWKASSKSCERRTVEVSVEG